MHPILNEILNSMKFFQMTYPEDACLVLADQDTVVGYIPGKNIDLKIEVGTSTEKFRGTVTDNALRENRTIQEERGPERFGFPYVSTATPIRNEAGEAIGVLSAIVSNQKISTLRMSSSELAAMMQELNATTDEIASGSSHVNARIQEVANSGADMEKSIADVGNIIHFVTDIANQSNLLGLNAAIEAARAGESGRGFSVVADEIRKMASQSKEAAKDIRAKLEELSGRIHTLNIVSQEIGATSQEHSAAVQELKSIFEHLAKTAEELSVAANVGMV